MADGKTVTLGSGPWKGSRLTDEPYDDLQELFTSRLPRDAALYNDYHAQLVTLAKDVCRVRPRCGACPLAEVCPRVGL